MPERCSLAARRGGFVYHACGAAPRRAQPSWALPRCGACEGARHTHRRGVTRLDACHHLDCGGRTSELVRGHNPGGVQREDARGQQAFARGARLAGTSGSGRRARAGRVLARALALAAQAINAGARAAPRGHARAASPRRMPRLPAGRAGPLQFCFSHPPTPRAPSCACWV